MSCLPNSRLKKENKTKTQFIFPLLITISEIKFSCAEITSIINVAFTEIFYCCKTCLLEERFEDCIFNGSNRPPVQPN